MGWDEENTQALEADGEKLRQLTGEDRGALGVTQREPVAWRVHDFGDGWILFNDERLAKHEAEQTGALMQPLYL